ncbi:MAG: cyclic nucleotide-binding domain-containing protein [Bacteroidia bacterium]
MIQLDSNLFTIDNKRDIELIVRRYFGKQRLEDLLESASCMSLEKGENLMNEGEEGNAMFVLLSGALEAFVSSEEGSKSLGIINAGQSVGEMALLGKSKRTATIKATRNCILLQIEKTQFDQLTLSSNDLLRSLSSTVIARLDQANRLNKAPKVKSKFIALDCSLWRNDPKEMADSISKYWGSSAQISVITEEDHGVLNDTDFMLHIYSQESFDYVFLINSDNEGWNTRVKLNADKTVYFARESASDKLSDSSLTTKDELILCYKDGSNPMQVDKWFSKFKPNKIFRLREGKTNDLERTIRIVCEEQICLVFGGGGAHGLCNLGVVKALNELKIPIDIVGGTSIGSIFSGALALDFTYDYMYENVDHDISKNNPLNDYTFPFVALLKGKKMRKMLAKHFSVPIEHSWKNFFAVAANLSTSKTEIMQEGLMNKSIESSISIPGILPPSLYRNSLLIDGGVLNNLPSDIMNQLYHGHIISVDVVSTKPRSIAHNYKVGNWQYLKNLISGSRKNFVPNTMGTVMKAVTLASAERAEEKEKVSDIYIKPRVKKGFLAWKAIKTFETEGYNSTMDLLSNVNYKTLLSLPD